MLPWSYPNTHEASLRDSLVVVLCLAETPYYPKIFSFLFLSNRTMLVRFLSKRSKHMA